MSYRNVHTYIHISRTFKWLANNKTRTKNNPIGNQTYELNSFDQNDVITYFNAIKQLKEITNKINYLRQLTVKFIFQHFFQN